jgi:hypothetical protein
MKSSSVADSPVTCVALIERARKLRSLSVERGLLKETRQVQKVIDALVKAEVSSRSSSRICSSSPDSSSSHFFQFYRDDLHDECTVLAFRMMVKDLLVLFQAGNEGIINLLGPSSLLSEPSLIKISPADLPYICFFSRSHMQSTTSR